MIALYVILGLIVLILLLLCIPAHAHVTYREELTLDVRYLFLKFRILPGAEEAERAEKPKEKAKPKEKKPNPFLQKVKRSLRAEGFNGFLSLIGQFVNLTGTAAVDIIKKLRIREFDLYVMTGGTDAAAAAILYGKACAVIYPAAEMLFRLVPCRKHRVSVDLDYSVTEPYVNLEADGALSPLWVLHYALRYLFGVIPVFRRFMNPVDRRKAGAVQSAAGNKKQKR